MSDASCAVRCDRAFPRACLNLTFGQALALLDALARKSSHAAVGFFAEYQQARPRSHECMAAPIVIVYTREMKA